MSAKANKKPRTQRAVITIRETPCGTGFSVLLEFQPSIKNQPQETPAVTAALAAAILALKQPKEVS